MEAFFGKWKLDQEANVGVEEIMDAEDMPEIFKKKMREVEVFLLIEEVADEPGKYNWKVEFGEVNNR